MYLVLIAMFASLTAQAGQLNIALGTSVPADVSGQTLTMKAGPSRASGGEHIVVNFARPKNITEIKLTGYSAGKAGKVLIHRVTALSGSAKVSLEALSQFAKVTNGNPQNYKNLVMLTDTAFVSTAPSQAFTQIDLVTEGFTNNDSSILVQITSSDEFPVEEFSVSRTSNDETLGGMINESKYAKFGINELQSLMGRAVAPSMEDVVGKTFVCTNYTRLNNTKVDFKKRTFVNQNGVLKSHSDLQGPLRTWTASAFGIQMPVEGVNGCGKFVSYNTARVTGAGNLIAEVILDLNDYLNLCESAGFDREAARAVQINSTFPSVLDQKYVVNSYEFCRPAGEKE